MAKKYHIDYNKEGYVSVFIDEERIAVFGNEHTDEKLDKLYAETFVKALKKIENDIPKS